MQVILVVLKPSSPTENNSFNFYVIKIFTLTLLSFISSIFTSFFHFFTPILNQSHSSYILNSVDSVMETSSVIALGFMILRIQFFLKKYIFIFLKENLNSFKNKSKYSCILNIFIYLFFIFKVNKCTIIFLMMQK